MIFGNLLNTPIKDFFGIENPCTTHDYGTVPKETTTERTTKEKAVNMKDNIKAVQTAFSTIDIKTTKCKYCEIKSKSQEELTKITKREEIIKRKDLGSGDLKPEVTEWFEIHSDKVRVKLCGDKAQKLADKLKTPGGEEKLRIKIEKYLKKMPDNFPEGDDDIQDFRKQLPDSIIRQLKMCLNPTDPNLNIFKMELIKYCSRFKIESIKKVIINWLKNLNFKKRDFLGRNVKKDDILKSVVERLEPLVLDRPKSDTDFKCTLRSTINEIMTELPLALSCDNKEFYLNKVTNSLVDEIFNIESKIPSTYIQPTITEVKEFVKDEITFFLEKSRVAISTKRMESLEKELVELLLEIRDIGDIDSYLVDEITTVIKMIAKLPEYKAKYFSNILLSDYKEFFFRERFFQNKDKTDHGSNTQLAFQHPKNADADATNFSVYMHQLIEEIRKWFCQINLPTIPTKVVPINVVVKDLACDIIDRQKYLLLNPNSKGTDAEEYEHLKYQIFKWTNRLVGEENTTVLKHAQELMEIINKLPKPLFNTDNNQLTLPQNANTNNNPYIESLTEAISKWFHELPIDLYATRDENVNKQFIKDFANIIEKGLIKEDSKLFDKEVGNWTKKVFSDKLSNSQVEQLKKRINEVINTETNEDNDLRQQKAMIRSYEDIVDEWIVTIPRKSQHEEMFLNNRIELIHDLAVKIFHVKTKMKLPSNEVIKSKLHEEISNWMKKIPMYSYQTSNYAANLVNRIKTFNIDKMMSSIKTKQSQEFTTPLEVAMLEWLKKSPLYENKSREDKEKQEAIMKKFANKIQSNINSIQSNSIENFTEYILMLDPNQTNEVVQSRALQIKFYLQKLNMLGNYALAINAEEEFLVANTEVWLNNLPLEIHDVNHFELLKKDFTESIKRLRHSGSDCAVIKKEILTFMKTLPIDHKKMRDKQYFDEQASKLIQNLKVVLSKDMSRRSPLITDDIIAETVRNWADRLPMKSVYCPRELRTFIDDISSVITTLLLQSEPIVPEGKDTILHREIVKFLRRFPLRDDKSNEKFITLSAEELTKKIKDIHLFNKNEIRCHAKSVAVFGVTLKTEKKISIVSIHENDINTNLERYTKQVVYQIRGWFEQLNLPNVQEEGLKEVVINDLAGDIIDRHKYLEYNPASKGTVKDEIEHLKYQIFKLINKLVGEENVVAIDRAESLMQRIQAIPVPMLAKPQDKGHKLPNRCQSTPERPMVWQQVNMLPEPRQIIDVDNLGSQSQPPNPYCVSGTKGQSPINESHNFQENVTPAYDQTTSCSSFGEKMSNLAFNNFIPGPVWQQGNLKQMYGSQTGGEQNVTHQNLNNSGKGPEKFRQTKAPIHGQSDGGNYQENTYEPNIHSAPVTRQQVNEHPMSDSSTDGKSFEETFKSQVNSRKRAAKKEKSGATNPSRSKTTAQDCTKEAIYNKYQQIFRKKCDALPIEISTPEDVRVAEFAKAGIYNGIVKTFFKLRSDSEIGNDFGYFEFLLEEKVDEMLDILPQSPELVNKRYAWKIDVLTNATNMLDELDALYDRPSFRQRVRKIFNRNFAREMELEHCFLLQQGFLSEMADAYILEKKHRNDDPVKAAIYKQRLMIKIDDLTNHLVKAHNIGSRLLQKEQLARIAMKVLKDVQIPTDDDLSEEAEEIQIADELEKWYKGLPTKPLINETDGILRKRIMDLLAKKLCDIEKRVENKDSPKDMQIKHEVSQFLEKRAKLHRTQDMDINSMVNQLLNRLKNKWSKEPEDYDIFETEMPLASTFAQVENNYLQSPLFDAATSTILTESQYQSADKTSPESLLPMNLLEPNHGQNYQPIGQGNEQRSILQNSRVDSGPDNFSAKVQVYGPSGQSLVGDRSNLQNIQFDQGQYYDSGRGQQPLPGQQHFNLEQSQTGLTQGYGSGQGQVYQSVGQTLPGDQRSILQNSLVELGQGLPAEQRSVLQNFHSEPGQGYVTGQNIAYEPINQGEQRISSQDNRIGPDLVSAQGQVYDSPPQEPSILQNKIDPGPSYRPIKVPFYQPGQQRPFFYKSQVEPGRVYSSMSGQPIRNMSPQMSSSGGIYMDINLNQMGPNQVQYSSPALQVSGQDSRSNRGQSLTTGLYQENYAPSQMGSNARFNSHQIKMQNVGQSYFLSKPGTNENRLDRSNMGPGEFVSQQNIQMQSIAHNSAIPININENNFRQNQFGLSKFRPNQEYDSQQGPGQGGTMPRTEARHGSYMQNIHSSLRQSKIGTYCNNCPHESGQYKPNLYSQTWQNSNNSSRLSALSPSKSVRGPIKNKRASHSPKSNTPFDRRYNGQPITPGQGFDRNVIDQRYGIRDHVNFDPNFYSQGNLGDYEYDGTENRGNGSSDERDDIDSDYLVKCRCVEAYKKKKKALIDYDYSKIGQRKNYR